MTSENPYAGQGPVLLDIGGDVGALVVAMPAAMEGIEVEIHRLDLTATGETTDEPAREAGHSRALADRPAHPQSHAHAHEHAQGHDPAHGHDHAHEHSAHRPHVAVVGRPVESGVLHSLVFPELVEGVYELYQRPSGPVELTVTVTGGEVTEATWPR